MYMARGYGPKIVFHTFRFGTAVRWRGGRGYGKGRIGGGGSRHTCNSPAYLTNTLIVLHVSAGGMFAVNCAAHTHTKRGGNGVPFGCLLQSIQAPPTIQRNGARRTTNIDSVAFNKRCFFYSYIIHNLFIRFFFTFSLFLLLSRM